MAGRSKFAFAATLVYEDMYTAHVWYKILRSRMMSVYTNIRVAGLQTDFVLTADEPCVLFGYAVYADVVQQEGEEARNVIGELEAAIKNAATRVVAEYATEHTEDIVQALDEGGQKRRKMLQADAAAAAARCQFDPAQLRCTITSDVAAFRLMASIVADRYGFRIPPTDCEYE